MERIKGQVSDRRAMAKYILSWITCAERELTTVELQDALAVEVGESDFDPENLPDLGDMVSVCAGLVTNDEHSDVIRFVHYTAQEYFQRTSATWFPNAQHEIAEICMTYISFNSFEAGCCPTEEELRERLYEFPLYSYAAGYWGHHIRGQRMNEKLLLRLLGDVPKLSACVQALVAQEREFPTELTYNQVALKQFSGLHLTAYFGLDGAINLLLRDYKKVDIGDSFRRTPLSWAGRGGGEAVVQLLLGEGANPDFEDMNGRTPLWWAALSGDKAALQPLLNESQNPDCKDCNGETPLSRASRNDSIEVVRLLLKGKQRVDPNSGDNHGRSPLWWAVEFNDNALVEVLLKEGADPDFQDKDGRAPLWWAAYYRNEALVQLLLQKSENPDCKDNGDRTPLSIAITGFTENLKLQLGLDSLRDYLGGNSDEIYSYIPIPKLGTASLNKEAVVARLLRKGADPDIEDTNSRTPLWWAASFGEGALVQLLLKESENPDCKDSSGETPLLRAARNGFMEVVKYLLVEKPRVDPNSRNNDGQTPLWQAAANGHEAVVELLLATEGVDPDCKDSFGSTPLAEAAGKGHIRVAQLLLEKGVNLDSEDKFFRTPLMRSRRNEEMSQLLLKEGADPKSIHVRYQRGPLWGIL